ncbi:MAG: hypothetical protein IPI42_14670 [Saprospiraceae bacterium]|nr:hypothetical protein [Candidatus Parvibacillus calidus]
MRLIRLNSNGLNDFGDEAIETLLKLMEDERGKFAVIAAGISRQYEPVRTFQSRLKSRFDTFYNLPDYNPEQLFWP